MNEPTRSYRVLAARKQLSTEDWLKLRLNFLNCSEIATAIGLNPYQTPNSLWAIKTGIVKPEYKDNDAMRFGRILEPVLNNYYAETENCTVKEVPYILQSIEKPWICGNIDGVAIYNAAARAKGQPEKAIIEIKTGNSFTESEWGDNACPAHYMVQLMMYEWLCNVHHGYLVSLIGGQKYHVVRVDYDEATVKAILKQAEIFWHHVQTRTPLPVSYNDNALISQIYPTSKPSCIVLPEEFSEKIHKLCNIKEQISELKKCQEQIEAEVKMALAENESASVDGYTITYKTSSRSTFSAEKAKTLLTPEEIESCTQVSSTRTLRISKSKPAKK